ncbi:mechanosensitive ion channel family protein [Alloalcanivorax marinus]|uniref:mechanosensitive ion channel family protein n=1 Tax=Alloalcanivorax marinus TaxID=1177169 RepID=UPI0019329D06|nr:mechanosensitive ion channel domain-containing protein [Alloalcanivorax marinus]MBL7250920.1 mechanosensitive ion channel [Alloalcanivorax marinus]
MNESGDLVGDLAMVLDLFDLSVLALLALGGLCLWALNWGIQHLGHSLMERVPARRFLILQLTTLIGFAIYTLGTGALILGVLNPPREFILAAAGSVAVALGFALKDVAASLVAGLLLLFDRPFQVGDRITFDDTYGEIVSMGLRAVRVQTLDDNLVTIPNALFITDVVASGNAGELDMMVVTDFHVGLDADLEAARDIIEEVIVTSRYAFLKKPVTFAIEEVAVAEYLAIRLRAKAYVLDVHYEKAFQSDLVLRVTALFRERGIARPRELRGEVVPD